MSQNADYARLLSERTGDLRRLAAHAAYAIDGVWPTDDPWPDRIDSLCEGLRSIGDKAQIDSSGKEES